MTSAGCQADDAAERAAIEERPYTSDAPVACTCDAHLRCAYVRVDVGAASRGSRARHPPHDDRRRARCAAGQRGAHAGPKETLPLVCPATFRGNHRSLATLESVGMQGLDLDTPATADPEAALTTIASTLGDVEVHAHSSFSSEPGAYRLRAFVPYDAPATADEHRASWSLARRVLERAGIAIDSKCADPSRNVQSARSNARVHVDMVRGAA